MRLPQNRRRLHRVSDMVPDKNRQASMNTLRLQKTDGSKTFSSDIFFGQKTRNADSHTNSVSVQNRPTGIPSNHGEPALRQQYASVHSNSAGIPWIQMAVTVPEKDITHV